MAESNEEPPRCPCGFWGSAQTSGLCSKCFKQQQQKKELEPKLFTATAPGSSANSCQVPSAITGTPDTLAVVDRLPSVPEIVVAGGSQVARDATAAASSQGVVAAESESADGAIAQSSPSQQPIQKNKKRCFSCRARLELAFVEIGRCKCGYTFCELHRLPEQHACTYDHKTFGRQEAREKMVSPKKHVGTSLRRLDSDS